MARLKIDLEGDPEISVIGISSHVNDYRLCWSINRTLGLELSRRRVEAPEAPSGPATPSFTVFDHTDPETDARCSLVNNHASDGVLLRELRQADYFLVVDKDWSEEPEELLRKLRTAEFVLTAFPLQFDQLREGYKLLL
jgi:hypothetical protein